MEGTMKGFKVFLIMMAIIVSAVILVGGYAVMQMNRAIELEEMIMSSLSDIDVQLQRRSDLIPNLVDCVKAYDAHEYEALMAISSGRGVMSDDACSEIRTNIHAVAEAYPELKASENYRELMNELSTTENLIAGYRSNYNKWVRTYRQHVRGFPNSTILELLGYGAVDYVYMENTSSSEVPINLFD